MRWKLFIFNTKTILKEENKKDKNYFRDIRKINNIFYDGLFANIVTLRKKNEEYIKIFRSYKI
jgi:hypothetical protein